MHFLIEYVRQFGRFQRNARLYLISNALGGITTGIVLVLYNLYLVSLGYGADFIGVLLLAGTLGAGLAIFPAGWCVDRFSGKGILIWSSLLIGVAGIGLFIFRQPIPLLVSGFVAGVGGAFLLVINAPFLTINSTPAERPHLFSLNIVLALVTTVLGKLMGGVLPIWFAAISWLMAPLPSRMVWILANQPSARSYQLALLFAGIIAGPSLVPLFLLRNDRGAWHRQGPHVPSPPPRATTFGGAAPPGDDTVETSMQGRVEAWHPLNTPRAAQGPRVSTAQPRATTFQEAAPPPDNDTIDMSKQQGKMRHVVAWLVGAKYMFILRSPIFLLSLTQVLIGLGAGLFIPYFNLFFVQYLHASSALFGLIDGSATAMTALFTLLAPWLALRIGKVYTIALTELASIPLLLIIGLTNLLPLAAILYLFRYGLMDMSNGIFQVFSMEAVPQDRRGVANSSYQASFQVPNALAAPLGGLMIVHVGYPPIFIAAAVCYLLSIAVLWGNFGRGKGRRFVGEEEKDVDTEGMTVSTQETIISS
jgi:MFS family permease